MLLQTLGHGKNVHMLRELRASPQGAETERNTRGLALKVGKSPANSPAFHAIPVWHREMQIGS
jgi:hypothetical protein